MNYDLRTSKNDGGQRMLNALLSGTEMPIHCHPQSNESVILLCGKLFEVLYDEEGYEIERVHLDSSVGNFGCVVPLGAWHTVKVLEPSIIYETKDSKCGQDGSEIFEEYKTKCATAPSLTSFSNSPEDIKTNIEYLIGMEHQSGSMDMITPVYVSRMLNVPLEDVEKAMKEPGI